jgi:D-hydroxyproline dehydrogenase subunit alpha
MPSNEKIQLLIIGGGPAGMTAALEARQVGVRAVCILDDNAALGGQIYRRYGKGFNAFDAHAAGHEYSDGRDLIAATEAAGVDIRTSTTAWGIWGKRVAFVRDGTESGTIDAEQIILATGARDRAVTFPGWTLPGVITAGAAKTLVAIQRVLPGKRIVVAGSGPLALAFSAQLRGYGANVVAVAEAAQPPGVGGYAQLLASGDPATLLDAARYRATLLRDRVPLMYSTIIVRAEGRDSVERVVLAQVDRDWRIVAGTERSFDCDTLMLGYGLDSSSELSRLLGCKQYFNRELGGWIPMRDDDLRTSVPGVIAAGDGSGIGGARHATEEGRLAGLVAARELGALDAARAEERLAIVRRRVTRIRRFRTALNSIYAVGPGLFELATAATIVCRCEEKTAGELDAMILDDDVVDPGVARAQSRIGMGRCQGRNCAHFVAATIARRKGMKIEDVPPLSVRPPVRLIPLAAIAEEIPQPAVEIAVS